MIYERDTEPTKMVFRRWKPAKWRGETEGDIIALMPELPVDERGIACESFMHLGQHSAADYEHVISQTTSCNPYASQDGIELLEELRDWGYIIEIRLRQTREMREARRQEARRPVTV